MTLFEPVRQSMQTTEAESELPAHVLQRLDITATWLWSCEPDCPPAARPRLVEQLNEVTSAVERLAFRHQFHPDEEIDRRELQRCAGELDRLHRLWSPDGLNL